MYKFIAHRGSNNHSFKENTKEAIMASLSKNYISGVEIDIRLTKDKKIVLSHNSSIVAKGRAALIKNKMLRELNLDTLDRALENIKTDKIIMIEIKYHGFNEEDIEVFYNNIKKYKNLNIYLCSLNYKLIKCFKLKHNDIKCGIIVSKLLNYRRLYNDLDFNSIRYNIYKKSIKETFCWTINRKSTLDKIDNNVYIITDKAYILNESNDSHLD